MAAMAGTEKWVAGAGIAGWFGFNAVMAFYTFLWRNSPDTPNFAQALVMPMHQHGRTFYVQFWEQRLVLIGLAVSLLIVFSAALLGYVFYRQKLRPMAGVSWLNACALAAFLAMYAYSAWPLAPQ